MKYSNVFSRLFYATGYSLQGLCYALKNEQAFQYEAIVFLVLCIVILIFDLTFTWNLILVGAWLFVMCLELVNSSLEKAFDLIDKKFRPEIKAGKDMVSATVFIGILFNFLLWICAFVII